MVVCRIERFFNNECGRSCDLLGCVGFARTHFRCSLWMSIDQTSKLNMASAATSDSSTAGAGAGAAEASSTSSSTAMRVPDGSPLRRAVGDLLSGGTAPTESVEWSLFPSAYAHSHPLVLLLVSHTDPALMSTLVNKLEADAKMRKEVVGTMVSVFATGAKSRYPNRTALACASHLAILSHCRLPTPASQRLVGSASTNGDHGSRIRQGGCSADRASSVVPVCLAD